LKSLTAEVKYTFFILVLTGISHAQSAFQWERFLLVERANQTSYGLCRASLFAADFKTIFREEQVPERLIWLALIESSFRPFAESKSHAMGVFQFKKKTAVHFGLKISATRDERSFPYLSARASARYLRYLYEKFHDWDLVLAAYNLGEGTLRRTLDRTRTRNWIQVKVYLRKETREYVPKIHAAARIGEKYLLEHTRPLCFLYKVTKGDTLYAIKQKFKVDLKEIRRLNGLDSNDIHIGHTLIIPLAKKT
jgi:membrane-bound lytic murein transglycosylase D